MTVFTQRIHELNKGVHLLGVTGTMGSGKSYTCGQLADLGPFIELEIHHVELDKVRIEMLGTSPKYESIRDGLASYFGKDICRPDTSIDRSCLRDSLFNDQKNLDFYNNLTHGVFTEYLNSQKQVLKGLLLIEWALLCTQGFAKEVDYNFLVVKCSYDKQLARIQKKSDLPKHLLIKGINAQGPISQEEEAIRNLQSKVGSGCLYVFDTTCNPGKIAHVNLLEKIVRNMR